MILILSVQVYYNFYIVNLVFVLPELERKTKKFKVDLGFLKRKHLEGTYLVYELRSASLNMIR